MAAGDAIAENIEDGHMLAGLSVSERRFLLNNFALIKRILLLLTPRLEAIETRLHDLDGL